VLSAKAPNDFAAGHRDTENLATELLLQGRAPRHEFEAEPIINHREPAPTQNDALAIDTADVPPLPRADIGLHLRHGF
jgi:hypothetical protein